MLQSACASLVELPNAIPECVNFLELVREIKGITIPWRQHYGEYQSGGWWTCSLLGRSADPTEGELTDIINPVSTKLLQSLPGVRKFLEALGLRYMMVRLARMDPAGALWEHRDYQDLRRVPRQRIHLPLETNAGACLISGGKRFHMNAASLWMFCPTEGHGSVNSGYRSRLHMILDVYDNERLRQFVERSVPSSSISLPVLSEEEVAEKVRLLHLMKRGADCASNSSSSLASWERAVLKLYFSFSVRDGVLYEYLARECEHSDDSDRAAFWSARRKLVLGEGVRE